MNIRSWRGVVPLSKDASKPFPWARIALVTALVAAIAYFAVPYFMYTQADGLIQGNLVPVSPMYRVRIDQLLVGCSDRVKAGQPLAVVSNFLVKAQYDREYAQSVSQIQLSQIALDEGIAQAQTNASMLREKYVASSQDAQRLHQTYLAYDSAYHGGAISQVDWQSKRNEWLSAAALARSDEEAWNLAKQQVQRIGNDQHQKLAKDEALANQARDLADRVGHETLVAPVSGYIVNCVDRPSNVVDPSKPIYTIFQPQRAYVLAYFSPSAVGRISIQQPVDITVQGIKTPIKGRVYSIYPDVAKLPTELTRYFWQHQQWSKYRPVRISLESVPRDVREKLYYGAQVSVSFRNE